MDYGGDHLLWSLAMHPRIPVDLLGAQQMPARLIWQSEMMVWALERIDKRARLEAAADAAHAKAVAKMNKPRN